MNNPHNKRIAILILLFAATIILVMSAGEPEVSGAPGVKEKLPNTIGEWTATSIRFCMDTQCNHQFLSDSAPNNTPTSCPICNGPTDEVSIAEKNILPSDTVIKRKLYKHPVHGNTTVTLVISGKQRSSIHRPKWCLKAGGYTINERILKNVKIPNRKPLNVQVLGITRTSNTMQSYKYIYWFCTDTHETASHLQRILLMASDNLFKGISRRWTYVSIMTPGDASASDKVINEFIPMLYREITTSTNGTAASQRTPTTITTD